MTDDEVKGFLAINFNEYFKSTREKWYSNLKQEQDVTKLLYIFLKTPDKVSKHGKMMQSNVSDNCVHHYNIEILNLFDSDFQLFNTKPMIKNKLKELLSELKKFEVQTILVLEYKKINNCKSSHSSGKPIANNSSIDEVFKSMHQSMMKRKKSMLVKI